MRDAHLDVVDGIGQEEHRRTVRTHDHEIGDRRPFDGYLAAYEVDERAAAVIGRAEANRAAPAFGSECLALLGGEVTAPAVVAGRPPLSHGLLVAFAHLGLGAEALVGDAGVEQTLRGGEVCIEALTL